MFEATVTLDGAPLRHTFVSYQPDFEDPIFELTNDDGRVRFADLAKTAKVDLFVHAQNLAVRMLDGGTTSNVEKSIRFRQRSSGRTLKITERDDYHPYFVIMQRCYDVYSVVFRPIAPFNGASRRSYPWAGSTKPVHDLKRNPSVDCRYPETVAPGNLPWVQPQSVMGGRPLMHLKPQKVDRRLFGTTKRPATTVPHEFAHAVHFAMLSSKQRWWLAAKYGFWIAKELATGNSGTHRTDKKTAPLIAYTEAIGIFAQRFYLFATEVRPDLAGARLRGAFVEDELSGDPALAKLQPGYVKIGTRMASGAIKPHLTGASMEGAVYGAIFLDLASRTSLANAINFYLRCGGNDFDEYASYVWKQRDGKLRDRMVAVADTWKM